MRLRRLGILNDHNTGPISKKEEAGAESERAAESNFFEHYSESIKNLLQASTVVAENTKISFFVYSMEGLPENLRNIDEVNIQMFYQRCLLSQEF